MRISADSDHDDYWKRLFTSEPSIKLDGVEVDNVDMADDEEGWVRVLIMNGAYPVYANGKYLTEMKHGVVEITGTQR